MALHPYKAPKSADYAYLKIANKLNDSWKFSLMKNEFDEEVRVIISLTVAAYFEDVISYTGLWQTFIRKHKEMYGKYLPFYDTNDKNYYDDEVNPQDVAFLVWSVLQKENEGAFINPENPGVIDIAERMYSVLDEEFEKVPVNDYFLNYIQNEQHYKDFFAFKSIANWLFYDSYLLGFENAFLLQKQLNLVGVNDSISLSQFEYVVRSEAMFGQKTGPLALPLKEWLVAMLKDMGMEKETSIINDIESHASDFFRIKSVDETYFHVIDTDENEYSILCSSFQELSKKPLNSKVLVTSLVKFDGEWHVNGVSVWIDEEETYFSQLKEKKELDNLREETYQQIVEANNGVPIVYFKSVPEMQNWLDKVLDIEGDMDDISIKGKEDIVVFVSPQTDICIIPKVGRYVKDPKNPLYDANKAKNEGLVMLVDIYSCPSDMFHYLSENDMLPDVQINSLLGEERGHELIRDNTDFIARFFRWNNY